MLRRYFPSCYSYGSEQENDVPLCYRNEVESREAFCADFRGWGEIVGVEGLLYGWSGFWGCWLYYSYLVASISLIIATK